MTSRLRVLVLLSLASACAPFYGANPAHPGTLNYIEGSASLAGTPLTSQSVGSAELKPRQVLSTQDGKAEILLTPGAYLRLDDNSSIEMVSPDLTFTQLDLQQGRAMVEVDQIYPQNDIQIVEAGVPTQLLKKGLYEFNAGNDAAMVFSGKAAVRQGENRWAIVKGHHELDVAAADSEKPHSFNEKNVEGDLYNWSSLRSQYLSQASSQMAEDSVGVSGFMPGWFWDPYFSYYTFLGASPFFSPFGWGFYSPAYLGGFYGGYYSRGFYGARGFRGGGFESGGFHGGFHHGGGFRAGGGFHGAAGGGGRR